MNVIITGASGFIGRDLLRCLHQLNYEIWAIGRIFQSQEELPGIHYWKTDLLDIDEESIKSQIKHKKIDVLIHAAGQAHTIQNNKTKELFYRNNINVTQEALKLALRTGVKQFVFLSSSAVIHGNDVYADTKRESERIVCEFCKNHNMHFTIIRPVVVYGEGDNKGNVYKLIKQIDKRICPLFNSGTAIKNTLYIRNLSTYIIRILEDDKYNDTVLLVRDNEVITMRQLCQTIIQALNQYCILVPIPKTILEIILKLISLIQSYGLCKHLNLSSLRKATQDSNFAMDLLSMELTQNPPYTLKEGILNTVNWTKRAHCGDKVVETQLERKIT